jgi:membrane associated rhomboid family serine protease
MEMLPVLLTFQRLTFMTEVGIATLIILVINIFCTLQGLANRSSFRRNNLDVEKIIFSGDYRRLVSASFFHVSALHLILNVAVFCIFVAAATPVLGEAKCLLIYFVSLLGGNVFSLLLHRDDMGFTAATGASGAVSGIVFACIALMPGLKINIPGTHLPLNAWFYGLLYIFVSLYFVKSSRENIGHEGQLAGGLAGLGLALLMQPGALQANYLPIIFMLVAGSLLIFIISTRPVTLMIENRYFIAQAERFRIDNLIGPRQVDHEQEIDLILDKIHQNGISSLSKVEKEKLDHYSRIIQ